MESSLIDYGQIVNGLIEDFKQYLEYLHVNYNYRITIHQIENLSGEVWSQLLPYNFHQCTLCRLVKSSFSCWRRCISRQNKVRLKSEIAPYIGTCYAGVTEAVFPIKDIREQCVGFLCVSGYTVDSEESYRRAYVTAKKYDLSMPEILNAVEELNNDIPELDILKIQVAPLQTLLQMIFYFSSISENSNEQVDNRKELYFSILNYINSAFRNPNFSLRDICDHFNISYSYASHLFSEYNAQTFTHYVSKIRIEVAKHYLRHTSLPISFTSQECGFSDSNYFSSIFRKQTGMSPTEYRRRFGCREMNV